MRLPVQNCKWPRLVPALRLITPWQLQAMVPLWDALNHVTGRCNVRLHHDEDDESLQMIATGQALALGQQIVCRQRHGTQVYVEHKLPTEVSSLAALMWQCSRHAMQSQSQPVASSSTTMASWATQSSCGGLALWSGTMCTTVRRHAACHSQAT